MDISPREAQEIQEIEKQLGSEQNGPKILSQQDAKKTSVVKNILATLGITIGATLAIVALVIFPFPQKKSVSPQIVTNNVQVASPNVTVVTEYINPFSTTAQYNNPFVSSQNPFTNLTQ